MNKQEYEPQHVDKLRRASYVLEKSIPGVVVCNLTALEEESEDNVSHVHVNAVGDFDRTDFYRIMKTVITCRFTLAFNSVDLTEVGCLTLDLRSLRKKLMKTPITHLGPVNREIEEVEAEIRMHERSG